MAARGAGAAVIPVIGFLSGRSPDEAAHLVSAYREGLNGVWLSLQQKGLALLRKLIPRATLVAVLVDPHNPEAASQPSDAQAAATALGQKLLILNATTAAEIDGAFATLVAQRAEALARPG